MSLSPFWAFEAALVISGRWPEFVEALVLPSPRGADTLTRLVGEKTEAAVEGLMAAQAATFSEGARLIERAAFGRLQASDGAHAFNQVTRAAFGPAGRRLSTNARAARRRKSPAS